MKNFDPEHKLPDFVTFRGQQIPIVEHRGHYRLVLHEDTPQEITLALFTRKENGEHGSVDAWMVSFWDSTLPWEREGIDLKGLGCTSGWLNPQAALDAFEKSLIRLEKEFPNAKT